jgi:hypothetical protein
MWQGGDGAAPTRQKEPQKHGFPHFQRRIFMH